MDPLGGPGLIGRGAELQTLHQALQTMETGRRQLLLLLGDAGIGKTTLADQLANRAQLAGATVVWGRCWEGGGAPAYWPWLQVLRALTEDREPDEVAALAGPGASPLRKLLDGADEESGDRSRFYLFDAVATFLSTLAALQPLVLIFDDLHAADPPSLLLLRFVARERSNGRILIIGTYRDVEAHRNRAVGELVTGLAREGRVVRLAGLSTSDVRTFIRQATGADPPEHLVQSVHRTTEGNPFFVDEVVRLLDAETRAGRGLDSRRGLRIPDEVRETIRCRIAPLPAHARQVLTVAATIGREFDVGLLHWVSSQPAEPLLELLGDAIDKGVLQEVHGHPGRFSFAHTLIRDTLYEDLSPAARVRLHRQVGEALERLDDPELYLPQLAHHFFQAVPAGDPKIAITYALRAGRQALAGLAYEDALMHFERATEVASTVAIGDPLRCKLLLSMGDAQAKVGDADGARETFERAVAIARDLGDPERLALAVLGAGGLQPATEVTDARLNALVDEAIEALGPEDSALRGRLLGRKAMGGYYTTPRAQRDALTAEAVAIARRLDDRGLLAYALNARCYALWSLEDVEVRLETAREIVRLARQVGDAELALEGRAWRVIALLERADIGGVDAEIETYARIARELRQPALIWQTQVFRAMRALLDGRVADAERLAHEALRGAQRDPTPGHAADTGTTHQSPNAALTYALQLYNLRTHQGRLRELEEAVRTLARDYPTRPVWRSALAFLLCDAPDRAEVRALFERLAAHGFRDIPRDGNWLVAIAQLAEVCGHLGDVGRARQLREMLAPYDGRQIVVGSAIACRGAVSHYLGMLSATIGDDPGADRAFAAALEMHERLGARLYAARTRTEWARALLARGDAGAVPAATTMLEQAFTVYRTLGLDRPADQVAELLVALGPSAPAEAREPEPDATLTHEGEYWTVRFEGRTIRLRDTKGLRYLAALLTKPGREVHAIDLAGNGRGNLGDAGAAIDADARRAYRRRLAELQDEVEEARGFDDPEREAKARIELDFIQRELAASVGIGGRDRVSASHAERARLNVTRAIRTALQRIESADRALARHLDATIRTGTFCSYVPDPRAPVVWRLMGPG